MGSNGVTLPTELTSIHTDLVLYSAVRIADFELVNQSTLYRKLLSLPSKISDKEFEMFNPLV